MNDEIKDFNEELYVEMLENGELYDYITNLQQELEIMVKDDERSQETIIKLSKENERLKKLVNPKTQVFIDTQDMEERYGEELYKEYLEKQVKDYKSRCEKAVEYMNNTFNITSVKDMFDIMNKLEDILNGRSDE